MNKKDVYQMVTDRVIEELEHGNVPWRMPWRGGEGAVSYVSQRPYSFLNQMLLGKAGEYLTFNQAKSLGGSVKKGAKGRFVVFYKPLVVSEAGKDADGHPDGTQTLRTIPLLKHYYVFHIDDTEGIKSKAKKDEEKVCTLTPIEMADDAANAYVERNSPLKLTITSSRMAFYSPAKDEVVVPELSQYDVAEEFYSTLFHELTHSTLPESRCNRRSDGANAAFGSQSYSKEELVAEMGAAMSLSYLGIDSSKAFRNSVGYIQGWLKKLRSDKKFVVWAAGKAEQAVKYMFNIKDERDDKE